MIVNISKFDDRCAKSFLFYLVSFFQPYSISSSKNQHLVKGILRNKIPMGEELYNYLMHDITNINKITRLVDSGGKTYKIEDKDNLYNYALGIISFCNIDKFINKIDVEGNTLKIEEENFTCLQEIQQIITFWNFGIITIEGKKFYELNGFYSLGKDLVNGYLQTLMKNFKHIFNSFYDMAVKDYIYKEYRKVICGYKKMVKDEIKSKSLTIRFILACLAFLDSPFYTENEKKLIEVMYDQIRKILVDCDIHNIYLEQSVFYNSSKSDSEKGSKDKTTRVQIIFSLENDDIYSLRIDMPHKGVDYIHLNMEEVKEGKVSCSAIPITDLKEIESVKKICGIKNKDFFVNYGNLWFKKDFIKKIGDSRLEDINKSYLMNIYIRNTHYKIDIINKVDYYDVFNEFNKFLTVYNEDFIVMPTENVDIVSLINKARIKKWLRDYWEVVLLQIICDENIQDLTNIFKENIIQLLFADGCRYQEFSKDDIEELDFMDLVDVISEYIVY
jgi:hypothetical protein